MRSKLASNWDRTMFSDLGALMISEIDDDGEVIVVRASTRGGAVECPSWGSLIRHAHALCQRTPADVPDSG
jgi:hypothetical protein